MSNAIIVEEIRRSLVVKFNRPELRNPLSIEVLESLSLVVSRAEETVNFDSLVFTGSDGVFASGADLRQIAEVAGGDEAREFALRGQRLMTRIAELRCKTIAAISALSAVSPSRNPLSLRRLPFRPDPQRQLN